MNLATARTGAVVMSLAMLVAGCSNTGDAGEGAGDPVENGTVAEPSPSGPFIGDAKAGKAAFAQCFSCHSVEPGDHRTGPSLAGIIDKPAGSAEGFSYSPASAQSGVVWNAENLDAFLANPRDVIPETRMIFPGVSDPQTRAHIVAYLATLEGDVSD